MRYVDFYRLGRPAMRAKVRARWIVELQILRREREWQRLLFRVWLAKWSAWIRAKRVDALILLAVILGSVAAEWGIVYWLTHWR